MTINSVLPAITPIGQRLFDLVLKGFVRKVGSSIVVGAGLPRDGVRSAPVPDIK
jgi:hypothetical protein